MAPLCELANKKFLRAIAIALATCSDKILEMNQLSLTPLIFQSSLTPLTSRIDFARSIESDPIDFDPIDFAIDFVTPLTSTPLT